MNLSEIKKMKKNFSKIMRRWFKFNQNKLYRKYNFDPHCCIIRKSKTSKTYKSILNGFKKFKIKIYDRRVRQLPWILYFTSLRKFKREKYSNYARNLKYHFRNNLDKNANKLSPLFLKKHKSKLENKKNKEKDILENWKKKILSKVSKRILNKNAVAPLRWRYILADMSSMHHRRRLLMQKLKKKNILMKRSPKKLKHLLNQKKKKLYKRDYWLKFKYYNLKKKEKSWWKIRIHTRKLIFFFGFTSLKKFRFVLNSKGVHLKFSTLKVYLMININLFYLNFFDNIEISNNFIKKIGVIINSKTCFYPYRQLKINDIISFNKFIFKKMLNILHKRYKFNVTFFLKKYKKITKMLKYANVESWVYKFKHNRKNFISVPPYFIYSIAIMQFMLYRLPKRNELLGLQYSKKNEINWTLNAKVSYNC